MNALRFPHSASLLLKKKEKKKVDCCDFYELKALCFPECCAAKKQL